MRGLIIILLLTCAAEAQTKVNPKDGLMYVHIERGRFTMGCLPGDKECSVDETPPHPVVLPRGFWIGQTPVTVGAYKKYARSHGKPMPPAAMFMNHDLNPGWRDDQQPVVNLTWTEARDFCEASGGRLPTEAEFEYAARGGTARPRYGELSEIAWYAGNSGYKPSDGRPGGSFDYLKRVATKKPNAYQLYDILGNVFEWVTDWYARYDGAAAVDPKGPPSGEFRIVKGGNWNSEPRGVRASGRNWFIPSLRNMGIGFRCAQD